MSQINDIQTARLILRQWLPSDLEPFAIMNADPDVMAFYPSALARGESNILAGKLKTLIDNQGWGLWAVEHKGSKQFIGFVGLNSPAYDLPVTPCVEVGWRLAKVAWGQGYATEAGNAALKYGFDKLGLSKIYSFTSVGNMRSRSVMDRLGMLNTGCNFEHPILPEGHKLREHVLYVKHRP